MYIFHSFGKAVIGGLTIGRNKGQFSLSFSPEEDVYNISFLHESCGEIYSLNVSLILVLRGLSIRKTDMVNHYGFLFCCI